MAKETLVIANQKIHPIVEFFEIDFECRNDREFIDTAQTDRKILRSALSKSKGIYAFYNSEFEVIYVGKTKSNLWNEMKFAFNRRMDHYQRYQVQHPRSKYSEPSNGFVRTIRKKQFYLFDLATHFSAYAIEDDTLIDLIELMMIRIMPNDILNVRMEGNTSLRAYSAEDVA